MMRIGYLVDGLLLRSAPGRRVRSDQGTENQKPRIVLAPIFFFWLVILTCGTFSGTLLSKFHVWHNCLILLLSVSLNFCLFPA